MKRRYIIYKAGKKQEAWASDTNKFQNLMMHKIKRIRDIIKYYI